MSGKHNVNLSISAGGLNLLPNFQKKKTKNKKQKGERRLDMNTIFRWGLLGKTGMKLFRMGVGVQFLHKDKLKSEIFNENKCLLTKIFSSVNLNSEFCYF